MRIWAIFAICFPLLCAMSLPARAQDQSWLQLEAMNDTASASERASVYATLFPDVEGYQSGAWYAIVLGPMSRETAGERLLSLRRENLIPRDSFIVDGSAFQTQFWPSDAAETVVIPEPEIVEEGVVEPLAPEIVAVVEETLNQSRAAEDALSKDEKKALQTALGWFGFYEGKVDGAYGRGTRASFAAWQSANGFEPTGVLATQQRAELLAAEAEEKALYGFDLISEAESGIEASLPMALVAFQGYEPPFVQFAPRKSGGPRLILISEPGERASLAGMYDLLQSMEIMPAAGERALGEDSFTISAANSDVNSYAWARAEKGHVKGFVLTWTPQNADRMARIIEVLQSSFRSVGDKALDPGLVPLDEVARQGLLTGLTPRKPAFSRSGFYVSDQGAVLTLARDLDSCTEITIDGDVSATLAATDPRTGAAILSPAKPLSPPATATFTTASPARGSEIVIAGYAFGDKLPAPVLTFGRLDELGGLSGEPGILRLSAPVLEGDQGGPVLSATGALLGLLTGPSTDPAKALPDGVVFAADAAALSAFLTANALTAAPFDGAALTMDALSKSALGMTLRVNCWK